MMDLKLAIKLVHKASWKTIRKLLLNQNGIPASKQRVCDGHLIQYHRYSSSFDHKHVTILNSPYIAFWKEDF